MGGLPRQLFDSINQWISEAAFIMTQGLQVDATFNRGSNFTKNNCEERYPENYQTKKQSVVFRHEDPYRHRCQKWLDPESGNHVSQRVRPPSDGRSAQWQGTVFVFTDAGYQGLSPRASCSIFWPCWPFASISFRSSMWGPFEGGGLCRCLARRARKGGSTCCSRPYSPFWQWAPRCRAGLF